MPPLFVDMFVKARTGAALATGDGVVFDHGDVKDRVGRVVSVMGQVASVLAEPERTGAEEEQLEKDVHELCKYGIVRRVDAPRGSALVEWLRPGEADAEVAERVE